MKFSSVINLLRTVLSVVPDDALVDVRHACLTELDLAYMTLKCEVQRTTGHIVHVGFSSIHVTHDIIPARHSDSLCRISCAVVDEMTSTPSDSC